MIRPEATFLSTSGTEFLPLETGWRLCSTKPNTIERPDFLNEGLDWKSARVPGTVAEVVGPEDLDGHPAYDAMDWWYHTSFEHPPDGGRIFLRLDGLASLAEVWLNGTLICESRNMFLPSREEVTHLLGSQNELSVRFRSLEAALAERRPHPRWKTRLVDKQRLRWFRTTLLGRIPGWTPRIEPVGPWKPVFLEIVRGIEVQGLSLRSGWNGSQGTLEISLQAVPPASDQQEELTASLEISGASYDLVTEPNDDGWAVTGFLTLEDVEPWWPCTHGDPQLYPSQLVLSTSETREIIELGRLGFRSVELDSKNGQVALVINGETVFCRGACWTINDPLRLIGDLSSMRTTLELAAEANANMIRVLGTMTYEIEAFYDMCDELGLMVWQDFMFANMDYPFEDHAFTDLVEREVEHHIRRLATHPSVVTFCGSSETEQQAAMFGAPREVWRNPLFESTLGSAVQRLAPDTPYWPSTPTGGVLPFHVGEGLAHYYGIGAYRRPLETARMVPVKFSPECLGFSHVPEPNSLRLLPVPDRIPNSPGWKRAVPRDSGAAWDFEDIRDHYLHEVFGVEPATLRSQDPQRYLDLSRAVTGIVMSTVFDEWRSQEHICQGGLVWFLKDLRPGSGWGIIDSGNTPKPVYWYLRRAWSPIRVALLNRDVDGLRVEIHNEHVHPIEGTLTVSLYDPAGRPTVSEAVDMTIPPRSSTIRALEELTGRFIDANYMYRFGPLPHKAVWASLELTNGDRYANSFWLHGDHSSDPNLEARWTSDGRIELNADRAARSVRVEAGGAFLSDNYFDLVPGEDRVVEILREAENDSEGFVSSLWLTSEKQIKHASE